MIKKRRFFFLRAYDKIMGCARISGSRDYLQNVAKLISTWTRIIIFPLKISPSMDINENIDT